MSTRKQAGPIGSAVDVDGRLEQMQSIIDTLQKRLDAMALASPPPAAPLEAKIHAPETFNGERPSLLRDFLTQVRLVFDLQPSRYPSDAVKIKYASSYLRGAAFSWIQPYLDMGDPPPGWLISLCLHRKSRRSLAIQTSPAQRLAASACSSKPVQLQLTFRSSAAFRPSWSGASRHSSASCSTVSTSRSRTSSPDRNDPQS